MGNKLFSFFSNLFSTDRSSSVSNNDADIHSTDFGDCFHDSPGVNPATGLPMISSGGVDVAGNPYGTDLSTDLFSSGSIDYFDNSSTCHDDHWNSSSSSGSFDSWNSGGSCDNDW